MLVLKFGGTSVGSPERMKALVKLINDDAPKIVVLSAMSGTTNSLVEISRAMYNKDAEQATRLIKTLYEKYKHVVQDLYTKEETRKKGYDLIKAHFDYIATFTQDLFTIHEERAILAQGELLSTALFHFYLQETGVDSILLPALDFMRIDENNEPDLGYIEQNLKPLLEKDKQCKLFITQGYICRNIFGEVDNLKRGGSDYTATLIGAALRSPEVQIWTDIDGMHNNDPRIVKKTFPIAELSFDEASELAYFGAKILHPTCVVPCMLRKIPVRLKNTMQPDAPGTVIADNTTDTPFKAVAAKDGITAINIKSGRMLLAYGFLRTVFEVFERYKTPIDMITTSEVAVSLTIDDITHLKEIKEELAQFGTVETDENQTIICVVGNFAADKQGYAFKVFDALKSVPIRMISYGGSKNNISVLINSNDKNHALNALNEGVFGLV